MLARRSTTTPTELAKAAGSSLTNVQLSPFGEKANSRVDMRSKIVFSSFQAPIHRPGEPTIVHLPSETRMTTAVSAVAGLLSIPLCCVMPAEYPRSCPRDGSEVDSGVLREVVEHPGWYLQGISI